MAWNQQPQFQFQAPVQPGVPIQLPTGGSYQAQVLPTGPSGMPGYPAAPGPTPPLVGQVGGPGSPPPHRFGDINADPAYAPKSAPKGEREFERTYRYSFEEGAHAIRFVAHPILLPQGFHYMTYHRIPQDQGDDKIVQCTESYDPTQPCYICSLIKDLDDAAHNQNESVLNAEYLGERLANVLIENSPVYCRSILLPFIAKSRVAMVPGKQDPNKPQRKLYPDPSSITTGVLNIQPDKPETKFGGCSFPDRPFHRKLQILTLTDQDINERYQHLHMRDPAAAAAFYAEAAPAFRNPYLFDAQHGSWVYFNKGKKGTPMSLVCQPPSPLDTLLVTKFLSEKTYPNIRDWGKGGDTKTGTRLSWYEVLATVRYSWVGKSLENEKGWSLDLNQEDWMPRSPGF